MTQGSNGSAGVPVTVFVEYIHKVCLDGGARARLRRGVGVHLNHPRSIQSHRYLAPFTRSGSARNHEVLYAIAANIAASDSKNLGRPRLPLGQALGRSTLRTAGGNAMAFATVENRLIVAGRANLGVMLNVHLPKMVGLVTTTGGQVHWDSLTSDLLAWPYNHHHILRKWMQDFYGVKWDEDKRVYREGKAALEAAS